MKTTIIYHKVLTDKTVVRYISHDGKWWKKAMNGKLTASKPMAIIKQYGSITFVVDIDPVWGQRVIS